MRPSQKMRPRMTSPRIAAMAISIELVPAVRELIAKHRRSA
jgi:hypothetical protein